MSKFHLTYEAQVHPEGITKEELEDEEGACDAVVIMPLTFPEGGSYSWDLVTLNGRNETNELDGDELWKAWLMLTKHLSLRTDLRPGKAVVCGKVFQQVASLLIQDTTEPH